MSLAVRFSTGGFLLVLKVGLGFGGMSDIPVQVFRGRIVSTFHYCGPPKSLHGFLKQGWEAVFALCLSLYFLGTGEGRRAMHPPLLRTVFTRNRRQLAEDALAPSLSHLLLLLLGQLHLLSLFLYL